MNEIDEALAAHRQVRDALLDETLHALRDADWSALRTCFACLRESIESECRFDERALFPILADAAHAVSEAIALLRHEREALLDSLARLAAASPRHDVAGWRETFDLMSLQLRRA